MRVSILASIVMITFTTTAMAIPSGPIARRTRIPDTVYCNRESGKGCRFIPSWDGQENRCCRSKTEAVVCEWGLFGSTWRVQYCYQDDEYCVHGECQTLAGS